MKLLPLEFEMTQKLLALLVIVTSLKLLFFRRLMLVADFALAMLTVSKLMPSWKVSG